MAALLAERLRLVDARASGRGGGGGTILVGDRPSTDGLMARRLEVPFALVLSGVTAEEEIPRDDPPEYVVADLATLVAERLGAAQESA
jgi:ribonucleotide monophosphatase NagD (HAD superfamily)